MQDAIRNTVGALAILACASLTAAQSPPLFRQVGDPLPDGMGQAVGGADFEGDGDADLFTSTGVFLNQGGFFSAGPALPAAFNSTLNIRAIAIADVTGDGRVDFIVGRAGGSPAGISVYAAPAPGGALFLPTVGAFTGATVMTELCAADFDGDGDVDVIAATPSSSSPTWQLFLNNGTGTFAAASPAIWPAASTSFSWLAAGDFDGDGWIDVFGTPSLGGSALWRRNLGLGVFGPTITLASTVIADDGAVGDFDGDADDDVFVVDFTGMEAIHSGSPGGLVAGPSVFGGILGPPPLAADIEGDGDTDIIRSVVPGSGSTLGLLQLHVGGPAGLGPAVTVVPSMPFGYANPMPFRGIASMDVDGDGDPDLAVVSGAGSSVIVINGGVNGLAFAPQTIPFGFNDLYAPPADVDGDGDADMIRAQLTGAVTLTTIRNDGRGVFSGPVAAGSYPGYWGRALWGDLDNDGDLDLWATTTLLMPGTGTAVLNDGTGTFTAGATVAHPGLASALASGDFDLDGDLDIVMGRTYFGGFPSTFFTMIMFRATLGPGSVSYSGPITFGMFEAVTDIQPFDAEPDGDLDLLVGTVGIGGAPAPPRLYLNDGTGAFPASFQIAGALASTVATGDLNGDGSVDAVLGGQTWVQSGGVFVLSASHAPPLGSISLFDLDGNGTLDLLDASGRWYPGTGTGSFGAAIPYVPYTPTQILTAAPHKPLAIDLDADGDLDVTSPPQSGLLTVYSNMRRHAGRTTLFTPNTTVGVAVFGPPGSPWLLGSSNAGAGPTPYPPFGTLFLDLATAAVFASGTIPPSGRVDLMGFLPGPGLPGLTIAWQGLVGSSLTNGFDTVVLP